ncbi:MAG: PEGA domain-containing protein [Myxococcales bacterium]|nr:PEGA domain-containing protein [Myxococcales bacterium]
MVQKPYWRCALVVASLAFAFPVRGQDNPDSPPADTPAGDPGAEGGAPAPGDATDATPTEPGAAKEKGKAAASEDKGASPSEAAMEEARAHMDKGQDFYVKGLFFEAAKQFELAFEKQPFGAFLYNAGVAYERHGAWERAADRFEGYLKNTKDAKDRADVKVRIESLRARIGSTEPTPPGEAVPPSGDVQMKSLLAVRTNPEKMNVTLYRDDKPVDGGEGQSPFGYTAEAGTYRIKITDPEGKYKEVNQRIVVGHGQVYVFLVEMSQGKFSGGLEIVTDVPGADVYIGDKAEGVQGKTPYRTELPVGTYRIWIVKSGYREVEKQVEVELGRHIRAYSDLTRVDFGRLRAVSNVRGAEVFVDGKKVGTTPGVFDVPDGKHIVTVAAEDMKDWEETVDIRRGRETPIRIRLRPSVDRGAGWVTGALAVGALAGGIVLGVLANSAQEEIEADQASGALASDDDRIGVGKGFFLAAGADLAFLFSAVMGGLSIYYFVRDPLPDSEGVVQDPRDWAFTPTVSPVGAGANFRWSF